MRLLAVQASWTFERMSGIGVGHASLPLLRDLYADRPVRERRTAVARSAEFFNSHPYLAGVAVGALVRAERDHVPGEVISRLRTALAGPLGSLGDQLVWAGEVPALIGITLATVPWLGIWSVAIAVVVHNIFRLRLTSWGLDLGLREGLGIGAALSRSWLPRAAAEAQRRCRIRHRARACPSWDGASCEAPRAKRWWVFSWSPWLVRCCPLHRRHGLASPA